MCFIKVLIKNAKKSVIKNDFESAYSAYKIAKKCLQKY